MKSGADITQQRHEYNLLPADAVRRLGDQQTLLVSANKNPAIIETRGYFQSRKLASIPKRYGTAYLGSPQGAGSIKRVPLS